MAKKKAEVPAVESAVVETPENAAPVVENTNENETEKAVEQPEQENSEEAAKVETKEPQTKKSEKGATATKDIPANIQRILKVFKNLPELYVSEAGRVFTPDAKPSLRGNAILYKNPFYNSKS